MIPAFLRLELTLSPDIRETFGRAGVGQWHVASKMSGIAFVVGPPRRARRVRVTMGGDTRQECSKISSAS